MKDLKRTPLYNKHIEFNANMVRFANYQMPIQYTSIFEETKAVRNSAGLFDISHMGEIEISGSGATEFINYLVTSDISKLKKFQAKYTTMLYENGGIIDDVVIYNLPQKYLIVVNAANQEKDFNWIKQHQINAVKIKNMSERYFQLALQGPKAEKIISKVVKGDLSNLTFYQGKEESLGNVKVILSRTGYTGEDGFEIYGKSETAIEIWDKIMKAEKNKDISPCGLGARDLLRLEMGYCLYGNDITKETTPLEANLSWLVSFGKEKFIGKDTLMKQKRQGPGKKLVGISVPGKIIPRHGYKILKNGEEVGTVTSGNYSPNLGFSIALGYIRSSLEKVGKEVEIGIRNKTVKGKITKLPFWKHGTIKK